MPFVIALYLAAVAAAMLAFLLFRRMPVEWLLDYGERKATVDLYRRQHIPFTPYAIGLASASLLIVFMLRMNDTSIAEGIIAFLISLILFLIIIADFRTRIIPDQFLIVLMPLAILLWLFQDASLINLLLRLAAALAGSGTLWLVSWLGARIMGQEAMGMGDVKLLAAAGLISGIPGIIFVFVISFVSASIPALILLILRRIKPETDGSLAFGPFISVAVIIVMLFEHKLIELWYWWLSIASFSA